MRKNFRIEKAEDEILEHEAPVTIRPINPFDVETAMRKLAKSKNPIYGKRVHL